MNYEKILNKLKCVDYYIDGTSVSSSPKTKHIKTFEKIIKSFSKSGRLIMELHYERDQSLTEIKKNTGKSETEIESILKDIEFYFSYRPTRLFMKLGDSDFYRWAGALGNQLNGNSNGEIYDMPLALLYDEDSCLKGDIDSDEGAEVMTISEAVNLINSRAFDLSVVRLMSLNLSANIIEYLHKKAIDTARNELHGYSISTKYDATMFRVSKLAEVMGYRETHLAGLLLSMSFLQHLEMSNLYTKLLQEEPFRAWIEEGVEHWEMFDNSVLLKMSCYVIPGLPETVKFTDREVPKIGSISKHCNAIYKDDIKMRMRVTEALQLYGVAAPKFVHPYQFSTGLGEHPEEKQQRVTMGTLGSILNRR